MKRATLFVLCSALLSPPLFAESVPEVGIARLDCGTTSGPSDVARFSDTYAYDGFKVQLTYSCYLIKHGDEYLVWDAGQPDDGSPRAPKKNLVKLLGELGIKPEQVNYLGISHYHGDHIGQSPLLPDSTLLIGTGDWDALTSNPPRPGVNPEPVKHWISGGGKVETVMGDKDIFGDGTVVMLGMPGHTPGHSSLLVKLKEKGNVLISGDQAHFHENYEHERVPTFNTNRADTLASFDRFKRIAENVDATVIIQHDARDIDKLPAFPQMAR
ncbi:N-acyl homoserine lactonase family protein [Proteobacteria bacterium 005FR1]|nr:N-acyl homoserine lactonase family protein [Proteobacteria bacterium 005FR1]